MSAFKDYFFKTLRWPLIHRLGPLAMLVEGLARSMDETRQNIIWLRDQFNPMTCESDMMQAHGASRGIQQHSLESEALFESRTTRAYAWRLLGGGQLGLPKIMDYYGWPETEFKNCRDKSEERWAEFEAQTSLPKNSGITADDWDLLDWAINEHKPARSLLAAIQVKSEVVNTTSADTVCLGSDTLTVYPNSPSNVSAPAVPLSITGRVGGTEFLSVEPLPVTDVHVEAFNPVMVGIQYFETITVYPGE